MERSLQAASDRGRVMASQSASERDRSWRWLWSGRIWRWSGRALIVVVLVGVQRRPWYARGSNSTVAERWYLAAEQWYGGGNSTVTPTIVTPTPAELTMQRCLSTARYELQNGSQPYSFGVGTRANKCADSGRPWQDWRLVSDDESCTGVFAELYDDDLMCASLKGRSILLVGDSITALMGTSLAQLVKRCNTTVLLETVRNLHLIDAASWETPDSWYSSAEKCHNRSPTSCNATHNCIPFFDKARLADVVVLNRGIHICPDDLVASDTERLARAIEDGKLGNAKIFWRNTLPGHMDADGRCDNYTSLGAAQDNSPHSYRWANVPNLDRKIRHVFDTLIPNRVQNLDAYAMSIQRRDHHTAVLNSSGTRDCLHYCLPGPPDVWTYLLAFHLRHST